MKQRIFDALGWLADHTTTEYGLDMSRFPIAWRSWVPGLDRLLSYLYFKGWGD